MAEAYSHLEVQGAERQAVLGRVRAQIEEWGLVMPAVEPIVLHFGLNDFTTTGETEFWVANEQTHGYCGKFLFIFDGQSCPFHRHRVKHETFYVLKGTIAMRTDTAEQVMRPGDVLVMPPGVGHTFRGIGAALILEVSMPSVLNDNFFADTRIGENGVI